MYHNIMIHNIDATLFGITYSYFYRQIIHSNSDHIHLSINFFYQIRVLTTNNLHNIWHVISRI